jgi:phage FluMu gp28-like protein
MSKFFLPYQVRWIKDPSRKRLMVKSRQIGISLATAYDMVLKTGEKPHETPDPAGPHNGTGM